MGASHLGGLWAWRIHTNNNGEALPEFLKVGVGHLFWKSRAKRRLIRRASRARLRFTRSTRWGSHTILQLFQRKRRFALNHQRSRRVIGKPLSPTALKSLQAEITSKAERLVERLVAKGTFCAITELATFLPVDIVATAVGLPPDGRERMLVWAAQMFNCFGPFNDRARSAFPVLQEMMHYARTQAVRGKLRPGSWADAMLDAVDRGEVDQAVCPVMMIDYVGPSLDTTIYAIGSGVWLFANGRRFASRRLEFPQPSTRFFGWKHPFNASPAC